MKKTLLTACTLNALALPAIAEDPQKPGYFGEFMDLTGRIIADSVKEAEKQVGVIQDQIVRSKFGILADAEEVVLEEAELKSLLLKDHLCDQQRSGEQEG
tara:strand:+ start:652 stop:951 length:300 start_codon:yes stop_codon:yes gene_type:complete